MNCILKVPVIPIKFEGFLMPDIINSTLPATMLLKPVNFIVLLFPSTDETFGLEFTAPLKNLRDKSLG